MDFNDYQREAIKTAAALPSSICTEEALAILRGALGVCGEGGEIAEMVKKWFFQGHPLDKAALLKEMGDILWYLAILAEDLDIDFEDIALNNIRKLRTRYPEIIFLTNRSLNRKEHE